MASAARLTLSAVADQLVAKQILENSGGDLAALRLEFSKRILSYDESGFPSDFAQILVFGMIAGQEGNLANTEPFPVRETLRIFKQARSSGWLGDAGKALDSINIEGLKPGKNPYIAIDLYEKFLRIFDPGSIKQRGVWYTPPQVVRLMISETERLLQEKLQTEGLLDENTQWIDPACGPGVFLIEAIAHAAGLAEAKYGKESVGDKVGSFASRMHGFELMCGPHAVAHWLVRRELVGKGVVKASPSLFLTNTLALPMDTKDVELGTSPYTVIIGNPPWKRLCAGEIHTLASADMVKLMEDFKRPVQEAGWGRSLNASSDLYMVFCRWALWRIFEAKGATGRGVLSFVTNRNFLTGRGFGGLRKMLREKFDHIRIIDFRGNTRGVQPVLESGQKDENIFDIKTGVCILVAVATGDSKVDKSRPAQVQYADVWQEGAFSQDDKLRLADEAAKNPKRLSWRLIKGADMDCMIPGGFAGKNWPRLDSVFCFRSNGITTYRDRFSYAITAGEIKERIERWLLLSPEEAKAEFGESRDRKAGPALATAFDPSAIRRVSYRPLDIRFLYNRREFVDRPKQTLQDIWGKKNVGLLALEDGTGAGPAVWCHGLVPDQHAFRGSYGGWVFPLWDRREGEALIDEGFIAEMEDRLDISVNPRDIFDSILALLSAASYTTRFARDLENSFPCIPFPADLGVFRQTVKTGGLIRALQTFESNPDKRFFAGRIEGCSDKTCFSMNATVPLKKDLKMGVLSGQITLDLAKGEGLFLAGIPLKVWEFSVSGYPVLSRWLCARRGQAIDAALCRSVLDLVARINQLLHLFGQADSLLEDSLSNPLSFEMKWDKDKEILMPKTRKGEQVHLI